ncbi:MAG: ABC transporter permease subunit [Eubacterium sp.]|nr:ABC transporter permease subunit [Eubacterium sp.]
MNRGVKVKKNSEDFLSPNPGWKRAYKKSFKRYWQLYLLLLVPLILVIVFQFASYPGIRIAFMNYKPALGYEGSKWVGLDIFRKIFKDKDFLNALKATIFYNIVDLLLSFTAPIVLALMLNELRAKKYKSVAQTILYLPHFLSWVVIGSVAYTMFRPSTGLVNMALVNMGLIDEGIPFLTENVNWGVTYLLIGVWQTMGWGTIIYLAAITSIDEQMYESAMIDGANRWKRLIYITLPSIKGTIVTMLIMNLGRVMGSNFERLDSLGNSMVRDQYYQLAMYIYEKGLAGGNFSRATAVGLFQSVVGLILVLISDRIAKRLGEDGLL